MERKDLTDALAPGAECLTLERLGRYADGTLAADEQAAAAGHVRGCLNCQAELALLRAVTSGEPRDGETAVVRDGVARLERRAGETFAADAGKAPSRPRWSAPARFAPLAVAAVLAVAVAASLLLRPGRAPELPPAVTTGPEVTRSLAVEVRGPVGDLPEAPRRLEWAAVAGAFRYRARLMQVDRRELWSTTTETAAADLPPALRESLSPGRTFLWDVAAYDGSGAVLAESGPKSFRVVLR